MHTNDERKSYTTRALTERGISQETQINQSFCHRNHDCPNKKKPQGCYAIPHSASEAEDDSRGKKGQKKKALSGCSFIYTVSASNLPLIRFVIAPFFFPTGAVKSIFVITLVTPYHPLSADRRPFFSLPFSSLYNIH